MSDANTWINKITSIANCVFSYLSDVDILRSSTTFFITIVFRNEFLNGKAFISFRGQISIQTKHRVYWEDCDWRWVPRTSGGFWNTSSRLKFRRGFAFIMTSVYLNIIGKYSKKPHTQRYFLSLLNIWYEGINMSTTMKSTFFNRTNDDQYSDCYWTEIKKNNWDKRWIS